MKPRASHGPIEKIKMHLVARVPNEGARRLAWWIGSECGGDLRLAAWRLMIDVGQVARLLDGSVVPGSILLADLVPYTNGAVQPLDWYGRALGGWCDAPSERSTAERPTAERPAPARAA